MRTSDIGDDVISNLEKIAVTLGKLYRRVVLGQSDQCIARCCRFYTLATYVHMKSKITNFWNSNHIWIKNDFISYINALINRKLFYILT